MKRRRGPNRVLAAKIDQLRHLTRHDASFSYVLAPELLNGATELAEAGRTDDALELLDELVGLLETWPDGRRDNLLVVALGMTGVLRLRQERDELAEPALRRAVAVAAGSRPGDLATMHAVWRGANLVHLARCCELAGDSDEALSLVQQGVEHLTPHAPYDAQALEMLRGARRLQDRLEAG